MWSLLSLTAELTWLLLLVEGNQWIALFSFAPTPAYNQVQGRDRFTWGRRPKYRLFAGKNQLKKVAGSAAASELLSVLQKLRSQCIIPEQEFTFMGSRLYLLFGAEEERSTFEADSWRKSSAQLLDPYCLEVGTGCKTPISFQVKGNQEPEGKRDSSSMLLHFFSQHLLSDFFVPASSPNAVMKYFIPSWWGLKEAVTVIPISILIADILCWKVVDLNDMLNTSLVPGPSCHHSPELLQKCYPFLGGEGSRTGSVTSIQMQISIRRRD